MIDFGSADDFVVLANNADVLPKLPDESFQLIYIDPPFNTGTTQDRRTLSTVRSESGDRTGFQGKRYATVEVARRSYIDSFDDYTTLIGPRLAEARRLLSQDGTLYFHIDYREAQSLARLITSARSSWVSSSRRSGGASHCAMRSRRSPSASIRPTICSRRP
ncbi:MAG: DNA methyltransferase, partial [Acidimicrobiia bacterium]